MDDREDTQTELPVLSGKWLPETHAMPENADGASSAKGADSPAGARGYDPYNNALTV